MKNEELIEELTEELYKFISYHVDYTDKDFRDYKHEITEQLKEILQKYYKDMI